MLNELAELSAVIAALDHDATIDETIAKAERHLKLLRTARAMLGQKNGPPKPRASKKAKVAT